MTLYGNPLDFSKIYDIVMNGEIKLTYLLFGVYLFVLCSLGPFGFNLCGFCLKGFFGSMKDAGFFGSRKKHRYFLGYSALFVS